MIIVILAVINLQCFVFLKQACDKFRVSEAYVAETNILCYKKSILQQLSKCWKICSVCANRIIRLLLLLLLRAFI